MSKKDYHKSYDITCGNFMAGWRCSYCVSRKIHPKDSLGQLLESKNMLNLWSNKK